MSHMTNVRSLLRSKPGIIHALTRCGFKVEQIEVHDTPQVMYGYDGRIRPTKAEIIVRRQFVGPSSNDLGFRLEQDGTWSFIISDYDRATSRYGIPWQEKVTQEVGRYVVDEQMAAKGFRVEWLPQKDGSLNWIAVRG